VRDLVHLVRRPLIGLSYQTRIRDEYGVFGGMRTGRGNRILGGNLPQCNFVKHKIYLSPNNIYVSMPFITIMHSRSIVSIWHSNYGEMGGA
jgi:hypothetical protein